MFSATKLKGTTRICQTSEFQPEILKECDGAEEKTNKNGLWAMCARTHKKLIRLFTVATSTRKISDLGPMMPLFREMHWTVAFLGLTKIADLAAGSAVYISRLQDMRQDWSKEIPVTIKEFLD